LKGFEILIEVVELPHLILESLDVAFFSLPECTLLFNNNLVSYLCHPEFRELILTSKSTTSVHRRTRVTYLGCPVLRRAFGGRQFALSAFPTITTVIITSTITCARIHYSSARNCRIDIMMMWTSSCGQLMLWSMGGNMVVLDCGEQLLSKG